MCILVLSILFLKRSLIVKIAFIIEENLTVYDEHSEAFAKRHDEIIVNRAAAINQSSREHLRAVGYEISEFSTDAQSLGDGLNVEILDGVNKCDICNVLCNFCTSVSRRFSAIITIAIKYAGIKNARSREASFAKTPRKVNYGL